MPEPWKGPEAWARRCFGIPVTEMTWDTLAARFHAYGEQVRERCAAFAFHAASPQDGAALIRSLDLDTGEMRP